VADDNGGDALDDLIGAIRRPRPDRPDRPSAEAPTSEPVIGAVSGDTLDAILPRTDRAEASPVEGGRLTIGSRRAWQAGLAFTLGMVAFAGVLADAIASATLLSKAGPWALAIVWPLGGLGLLGVAYLQSRYVDRFARVPVLAWLLSIYGVAFLLLVVLFAGDMGGSWAPAVCWLLADQMNFLVPLIVWSLAGDVFTAGQGVTVFPKMSRAIYIGQISGLTIATLAPMVFHPSNSELGVWLFAPMLACFSAIVVFPTLLKGATSGVGHGRDESSAESTRATVNYVRELPAFNWLWKASFAVMAGGFVLEFLYFDLTRQRYHTASDLQTVYAGATLAGFVLCAAIQTWVTPRLLQNRGVASSLRVLPVLLVAASLAMVVAGVGLSLPVGIAALLLWRLPRWSIDSSARQAAQATIPDERRARTSFLIDLVPMAAGLIVVAVPIVITLTTHQRWVAPIFAVVFGTIGWRFANRTVATWDDTQLSYRLKRRKRLN
jgi:hypothetical protein